MGMTVKSLIYVLSRHNGITLITSSSLQVGDDWIIVYPESLYFVDDPATVERLSAMDWFEEEGSHEGEGILVPMRRYEEFG